MERLLSALLAAPDPIARACFEDFWSLLQERLAGSTEPADRAVLGGFFADRLGFGFAAGYQAALSRLLPEVEPGRCLSLAATEVGGAHPRAIETRLTEGGQLFGDKRFATLAVHAEQLVVLASSGGEPDARQLVAVLVDRAGRGLHVVRLKGGDPLVLGRGSEEAEACRAAGVPVELVPGVSSALAVPAAAGIPVTARGVASRFAVVSAHDEALDVEALASLDGTLVFLMGVGRLAEIAERLVAHGRPGSEPVAVVERGTRPDQRVTRGTLETIARRAREREVTNPAVIVVGAVAALEVTR